MALLDCLCTSSIFKSNSYKSTALIEFKNRFACFLYKRHRFLTLKCFVQKRLKCRFLIKHSEKDTFFCQTPSFHPFTIKNWHQWVQFYKASLSFLISSFSPFGVYSWQSHIDSAWRFSYSNIRNNHCSVLHCALSLNLKDDDKGFGDKRPKLLHKITHQMRVTIDRRGF